MHLAIIATLLSEMHEQGIDYSSILDRVGKFGGDKQIDLELGDD